MSETLIKVENVSKKFCRDLKRSLWYGIKDMGNEIIANSNHRDKLRSKEFWAVRDVSFELKRGECLGIIGHNGAGKSTLLKMLNGLIRPDIGRIEMRGRVGALIELGAGFNPILTGRENVYINGTILGFRKKEIDSRLDAILDFAEIGDFIDTPVQYYSSGMKIRLGFAVASQMEPDILILDEVLAVGDSGFRIKSFNKINELISKAAVIFVSHSMPTISMISNELLLLNKGRTEYLGSNISVGIEKYFEKFESGKATVEFNNYAQVEKITISSCVDQDESTMPVVAYSDDIDIDLIIRVSELFDTFNIKIQITDKDLKIVGIYDSDSFSNPIANSKDTHKVRVRLKQCIFINGEYSITLFISHKNLEEKRMKLLAIYRYITSFRVRSNKALGYVPAVVYLPGELFINDN